LLDAKELYRDFTGHEPDEIVKIPVQFMKTGLTVGECDGLLYTTVRDDVKESYIHKFKKSARPLLVASHDGAQLALIGGNFNFTERGIVDN
jgi:hypothetical protein